MDRKEFIKLCSLFGLSLPLQNGLKAHSFLTHPSSSLQTDVLIIGAGAAGLSAAYRLSQKGISFKLLEASASIGGRMKIDLNFTDFPLPLGAEWLETKPSIFNEIVTDDTITPNIQTFNDFPDRKFFRYSWFQFFEDYIYPSIQEHVQFNQVVESVNYQNNAIAVHCEPKIWKAKKIISAVPLSILRSNEILFTPAFPNSKRELFVNAPIWEGFKVFFKFKAAFYKTGFEYKLMDSKKGQKFIYDAAKGQESQDHIVGLLAMGEAAKAYLSVPVETLKHQLLEELDHLFDQQASPNYLSHVVQDWQKEPFIQGGYLSDHASWLKVKQLRSPIDEKIFFAGGAFTNGEDWVSVHAAARSGIEAAESVSRYFEDK